MHDLDLRLALRERYSDLGPPADGPPPIRAREREDRRVRTAAALARRGTDALLLEPGATFHWLTGLSWHRSERPFALVVGADGGLDWILPAFEERRTRDLLERDPALAAASTLHPWHEHEYGIPRLAAVLAERRVERLAVEDSVRDGFVRALSAAAGAPSTESAAELLLELRSRKSEAERALLREAQRRTQLAIRTVAGRLVPGTPERDLALEFRVAQERLGLTETWCLALTGANAALPHGESGSRRLERGDSLLVDTGGCLGGYRSDCTRSWIVDGPVPGEFEGVWHAVRDAQRAAFDALAPGVPCRAADDAARGVLTGRGHGPGYRTFTHRLGHGIGLEGHEAPYLDGGSEVPLAPGMCFSDEPGVYLPGRFGLRIEDVVAITEEGAEVFGTWQGGPGSPD